MILIIVINIHVRKLREPEKGSDIPQAKITGSQSFFKNHSLIYRKKSNSKF